MNSQSIYLKTLLQYYEEEISGEAYFYTLAEIFREREKTILLARAERVAAQAVEPLIEKYQLVSRAHSELQAEGRSDIEPHRHLSWTEFMQHIVDDYPRYIVEFESLEALAPPEDLPALKRLTEHEHVVIEFAHRELAGDTNSTEPVLRYLGDH